MLTSLRNAKLGGPRPSRHALFTAALAISVIAACFTTAATGQPKLPPGLLGTPVTGVTDGKLVEIEIVSKPELATPGQQLTLYVTLTVKDGWHLYANPKQGKFGLVTQIIPQPTKGLQFGKIVYPPGEEYIDKVLKEGNHIYEGTVTCQVLVDVDSGASGKLPVVLDFKGLLCSDAGVCLPWKDQAQTTINVTGEATATTGADGVTGWLTAIFLAIGAGLVMNLMPCVLPLIPIIVMTLMKQCATEEGAPPDRGKSIRVGLSFAAGMLLVFVALAILMSVFKLLWGQQFQGTGFKFALLMIVFVLSLAMFGLFEIALPARVSNIHIMRKGYLGAMAMGMLATVLATPCGAPLLGPVLAWSLTKPLAVVIAVFLIIGASMASPYVLLTAFPQLLSRVPTGGTWMIRLKQMIGFAMLGFSAYLISLFPAAWSTPLLYFCLTLAVAIWLGWYAVNAATATAKRYVVRIIAILLIVAASITLAQAPKDSPALTGQTSSASLTTAAWPQQIDNYQQQGKTVIVKFTANWCGNCQKLDKIIYKQQAFKDKLTETNTALVIADWSEADPTIDAMLRKYNQAAIPFALVIPAANPENPITLRNSYSLDDTLKALDQAANRK